MIPQDENPDESRREGQTGLPPIGRLLGVYRRMIGQFECWCVEPADVDWIGAFLKSRRLELRRESSDVERVRSILAPEISLHDMLPLDESLPLAVATGSRIEALEGWEVELQQAIRSVLDIMPMGPAKDLVVRAYVTSKSAAVKLREWPRDDAN